MLCSSLAHAPKSMSLQRSQQKGRYWLSDDHMVDFLQVGQGTIAVGFLSVMSFLAGLLPTPNNLGAMIAPSFLIDSCPSRSE